MVSLCSSLLVQSSLKTPRLSHYFNQLTASLSSNFQPFLRELKQVNMKLDVPKGIKKASQRLLDAVVDSTFQFVDQPLSPSQGNFAPVDEIGDAVMITSIEGEMPFDFPEGVYIRNGSNPMFGALQATISAFGRSNDIWVEGEGMLHAVYFAKDSNGNWTISYKNRYVKSETFKLEKESGKPRFLPTIQGDSPAILAAYLLNQLRFGKVNKYISNTNVFEHAGRLYSAAESHIPQEIEICSLSTRGNWDVNGAWDRPFTAHPKKAPISGELVILGVDAKKPYLVVGVISADGKKLKHKVDLKLERSAICHDVGVTDKYNIIMDIPLTIDINRLIRGGPLIKYEKGSSTRIGVMPRYGDANSVKWFKIKPCCVFHLLNCFEDEDEVVVRGFRANGSVIPTPNSGSDKSQQFSEGYKSRATEEDCPGDPNEVLSHRLYEWRLNMKTDNVSERYLTGTEICIEFPMTNENFIGFKNKYGYAQVVNIAATSISGLTKYGSLVKFDFTEQANRISKVQESTTNHIKMEYHQLSDSEFCSGAAFVPKNGGPEEDDGWIISFVHNEDMNTSQVHIIDTKRFDSDPIVKITLPQRVPYGFHGAFIPRQMRH